MRKVHIKNWLFSAQKVEILAFEIQIAPYKTLLFSVGSSFGTGAK